MKNSPAFPQILVNERGSVIEGGLTKRELFAAMAMQATLSRNPGEVRFTADSVAVASIEYADALLAELEKESKE